MPRQRNDDQHEIVRQQILAIARRQMQEFGTAALGMRSIARELKLAPSGLYRYFNNLDAIITALILDAFHALAETLEAVSMSVGKDDYAERLLLVMMAYRRWAQEHPIDFQLIYGNPIPGYKAPTELTLPAAQRSFTTVIHILSAAVMEGALEPPSDYLALPATTMAHLLAISKLDENNVPLVVVSLATVMWTRIHGFVVLELFNSLQPIIGEPEAFFSMELHIMLRQLGLKK